VDAVHHYDDAKEIAEISKGDAMSGISEPEEHMQVRGDSRSCGG